MTGHYVDCTCEISQVQFVTSIGTYLDSPYHFHPDRKKIADLNLDQLVLPGVVIDCTHANAHTAIGPDQNAQVRIPDTEHYFVDRGAALLDAIASWLADL